MSLPFDDGTFDVAHAHQVLQHLSDPVGALAEMRRVTRPGGIVAVRDAVYSAMAWDWCYATAADRAWQSETWAQRCLTSFGPQAVELGLARRDDLETMAHAWRQWGGNQDAWFVVVHGEVIARA